MILVVIKLELTPDQPIAEGNQSTFTCTASNLENITSYIWKLNNVLVPSENTGQYSFKPNRTHNGMKLSCSAITATGVRSKESQVILQVFCK